MRFLTLAVAFVTASFVNGQEPKPKPAEAPKVSVGKVPEAAKPIAHTAQLGELTLLTGESGARWEVDPAGIGAALLYPDGKGNATFAASAAGMYYAICYSPGGASWVAIEVIDNRNPDPRPIPPGPGPDPKPIPVPVPGAVVKRFIVVEDSRQAGQWRSDVIASSAVATWYKSHGLSHRLIDVAAPEGASEEAAKYLALAAGKTLPWLWLFDDKGVEIASVKCATDPEGFIKQLANNTAVADHSRKMGNKVPPVKLKASWKVFGDAPNVPIIPREKWKEVDMSVFLPLVKDQDGVGACNAFAAVTVAEAGRAQQGLPYRRLSPGYLYGNINGQRDDGSLLEDGMEWMQSTGTCLASTVPELSWRRNSWPAKAKEEAAAFVALEVYVCPNFDAMASALQQGFFIVEGLPWYDNFEPDAEGWLPARGRGGWGGHALAGYGLKKRGAVWGIATRNSWGNSWGKNGDCVIPETLFGKSIGGFWALRSMKQVDGPTVKIADPFRRDFATIDSAKDRAIRSVEFALAP